MNTIWAVTMNGGQAQLPSEVSKGEGSHQDHKFVETRSY